MKNSEQLPAVPSRQSTKPGHRQEAGSSAVAWYMGGPTGSGLLKH